MRIWRFPDQVIRLAILFAIAIAGTVAARIHFVPESFGELGHYRPQAIEANTSQPIQYASWQACVECHDEEGEAKNKSYHRTLACEICHGPAKEHCEDYVEHKPHVPKGRSGCLFCHSYLASRPTGFPQIIESLHNPIEACTRCHNAHDPTPPQVPGACSACHAQIARTKALSHHRALECETCHETVAEHRQSPRAYLPKKPTERKFCGGCHAESGAKPPEGFSDAPRVEMEVHGGRYLCWQCHYPHFPEAR
ncbi:MAG: cytochrome c3 family protein [Planctomycetota bacterium]